MNSAVGAAAFLLLCVTVTGVLSQEYDPFCWDPLNPDDCGRANFPDYEVLYGMFFHCDKVPSNASCHINTQESIECHNLRLSRSPVVPSEGTGFKLSTHTNLDELCEDLVIKVLGLYNQYAGCAWGEPIDQQDTILYHADDGWNVLATSYYDSIACSFEMVETED